MKEKLYADRVVPYISNAKQCGEKAVSFTYGVMWGSGSMPLWCLLLVSIAINTEQIDTLGSLVRNIRNTCCFMALYTVTHIFMALYTFTHIFMALYTFTHTFIVVSWHYTLSHTLSLLFHGIIHVHTYFRGIIHLLCSWHYSLSQTAWYLSTLMVEPLGTAPITSSQHHWSPNCKGIPPLFKANKQLSLWVFSRKARASSYICCTHMHMYWTHTWTLWCHAPLPSGTAGPKQIWGHRYVVSRSRCGAEVRCTQRRLWVPFGFYKLLGISCWVLQHKNLRAKGRERRREDSFAGCDIAMEIDV